MSALARKFFPSVILFLAVMAAYSPSLRNHFIGDDYLTIVDNSFIHSLSNVPLILTPRYLTSPQDLAALGQGGVIGSGEMSYRPVVTATYFMDYLFWKLNPFGYHLTNVILHSLNAVLVFLLAVRLTQRRMVSWLAALVFALHPVQAESVLVVSFREDLLVTLFGLCAILLHGTRHYQARPGGKDLMPALCLGLALFSKEAGLVWLPVILLYDYFLVFDSRARNWMVEAWLRYRFMALITLVYVWVRFGVMTLALPPMHPRFWTNGLEHLAVMAHVAGSYLWWMVWPFHVPATLPTTPPPVAAGTAYLSLAGFGAAALVWRPWHRGPLARFSTAIFIIMLLSVSQVFTLDNWMASRYLYLAMIALALILAVVVGEWLAAVSVFGSWVLVAFGLLCTVYVAAIIHKTGAWTDEISFRQSLIADYPREAELYRHLSGAYERKRMFGPALAALRAGESLAPADYHFAVDRALIYERTGDRRTAVRELEGALQLHPPEGARSFIKFKLNELGSAS